MTSQVVEEQSVAARNDGGLMFDRTKLTRAALCAALVTSVLMSQRLVAAGADAGSQDIEEIVVTARKSSERLQDVPISITAVSEETLQRSGAETIADIAREVPGLNVVAAAPGQNQLIIRGVSSSGGVPTVGYYIDDTPIQSTGNLAGNAMDPALFDLERVEVLRGPQGTLYGASSMGGTVKYVTRQPDLNSTSGYVKTSLSDTDGGGFNYEVSGLVNQPLMAGVAALRAIVFYRDQDGYIDRHPIDRTDILAAGAGPAANNVNTERTWGTRISVEIKPTEAFSITPSIFIQRTDLGAPFTFDAPPGSFEHPIQTRDSSEPSSDKLELYTVTMNGDAGAVHITSSTAYRSRRFDAVEDDSKVSYFYFSPVPQSYVYPTPFDNYFANHDFTEEVRASGDFGPVHGLVGLFYQHQDNWTSYNLPIPAGYNAAFGTPFGDTPFYMGVGSAQLVQRAAYGEVNVKITPQLQATVGLRTFEVKQYDHAITTGVFNGGLTDNAGISKDNGTNPKFSLSYAITPDALTYATVSKGFRQGGPIPGLPSTLCAADLAAIGLSAPPTSFKSDTLWNYELGAKTGWLDRKLTVDTALYYIKWTRLQQLIALPTCGFDFTGNFGSASSKGTELEVQYNLSDSLRLTVGGAYNEAKLDSNVVGAQGRAGDTLEDAPRWMGSVAAEYRREIAAMTYGFARADFSSVSKQYNNFNSGSIYYDRPGYSLLNLRLGVDRHLWEASLFIDNALDKHAETALPLSYAIDLPTTRRVSLNRPRTIGLDARINF
jgi:outer membrane receptor protein involved in Fe transport